LLVLFSTIIEGGSLLSLLRGFFALATVAAVSIFASDASAVNLLGNPSFETPDIFPPAPPDQYGAGAPWTSFGGGIFTIVNAGAGVSAPAQDGDQSLKTFGGCCSGAYQQFPANPGETWNGGAWLLNPSSDLMVGGQVGAVNIEWIQADAVTQSTIIPFISNGTFTAASPVDTWTLQTITGIAPADAAFARFVVITGDFLPGGPGGAPFFDNAFLEVIPEPASVTLAVFGLLGVLGTRRRTVS